MRKFGVGGSGRGRWVGFEVAVVDPETVAAALNRTYRIGRRIWHSQEGRNAGGHAFVSQGQETLGSDCGDIEVVRNTEL